MGTRKERMERLIETRNLGSGRWKESGKYDFFLSPNFN
jgi:hypothetical protein